MAMVKNVVNEAGVGTVPGEHGLKLVQRDIAAKFSPIPEGAWPVEAVEGYISDYLNQGWILQATLPYGVNQNGTEVVSYKVMFVLVK